MENQNPFNTGSPARGEGFFDREEIIDDVILFLKKTHEFNFLIFGQRRIGKTSLLRKIQDGKKLCALAYPVYFNLQDKARNPLPRLLFEIAQRIAADLDLKIKVKESDFKGEKGPLFFKDKFLPAVCDDLKNSKKLLLLFDEFDVLGDEIEDIEKDATIDAFAFKSFIPFMVSLIEEIQQKKYPVKFVFAVGRNYKDLDPKRYGQVTKFGPQREISYFSKKETKKFLHKNTIIPFSENAIDEIFILTSGHPYFTQCLASAAFDNAEKNSNKTITKRIIGKEFISTIKSFSSGVYWIWDSLSGHDQIILYLMAILKEEKKGLNIKNIREKAFSLNFAPAVKKLTETLDRLKSFKFIKEKADNKSAYDFYVEFVRKWIAQEITESEIAKKLPDIDEEIEFLLNNARYYFSNKKYEEAIGHYEQILKKSPYHFEALLYLARSYKNLIDEDNKYLEKSLTAYKNAFLINQRKTKKEYLKFLNENRKYLEEKGLYEKFIPEKLRKTFMTVSILRIQLENMEKLKEIYDKVAKNKIQRNFYLLLPTIIFAIIRIITTLFFNNIEKIPAYIIAIGGGFLISILIGLVGNIKEKALDKERKKTYAFYDFNERAYLNVKKALDEAEKSFANKI